jgi:hypothetical protein
MSEAFSWLNVQLSWRRKAPVETCYFYPVAPGLTMMTAEPVVTRCSTKPSTSWGFKHVKDSSHWETDYAYLVVRSTTTPVY